MTSITPTELTLLRSRPHETNLWLSIYKPPVAFACQLNNGSAAPGLRLIDYDNVTVGVPANVWEGMTMYIGTTPGARDVGKIRVRSITGGATGTITVAANSDINWTDDLYLTIVEFVEIGAVYPRMYVPDPGDPTQQIWYKDYDIAYANQNSDLGMFICMGSHYAGFVGDSVYFTASGTYNLLGHAMSYYWLLPGTTIGTSLSLTPGYCQYITPGHYSAKLTVTDTTTFVDEVSYRHISIYDRPGEGSKVPILNWELESLDGSRDAGSYTARIKVRENISDIIDGALVVIFSDDAYAGTKISIGGNSKNRQTIFFVGYILDGSISYNYEDSSVEFNVGSPTEVMKLASGLGIALNSSTDPLGQDIVDNDIPSAWALMLNMDCKRAIYHYLRWHSTVLMTNDFQFMGTDKYIEYFYADRESLFDTINTLMEGTLYGGIVCDRQGKIWSEVSIAATDGATGSFPSVMDIVKQDWIGTPTIEEAFNRKLSYMEMGGINFDPTTPPDPAKPFSGTSLAFLACAPGTEPSYRGNVQTVEGLALLDQNDLNALCGNVFAYLNSRYAHIGLDLSGNYRNIDIAPQEIITLSLDATDTPKGIIWNKKALHPTDMSWTYDPQKGTLLPTLTLHEVTQGFDGTTIVIPSIPPTTDPGGGGFDTPPIWIPPIWFPSFPSGTSAVNCDRWVDAEASWNVDGVTYYNKEENGWYFPDTLRYACGYWRVPDGCSGNICIFPIFIFASGTYTGIMRTITATSIGVCGGPLYELLYIHAQDTVPGTIADITVFCPPPGETATVVEGEIIKLVVYRYYIDDDPSPFYGDVWFLGWDIKYETCPTLP